MKKSDLKRIIKEEVHKILIAEKLRDYAHNIERELNKLLDGTGAKAEAKYRDNKRAEHGFSGYVEITTPDKNSYDWYLENISRDSIKNIKFNNLIKSAKVNFFGNKITII